MALIFSLLGIYRDIFSLQTFYKLVEVIVYVLCSFVHTIVLSTKLGGKTMFKMSLKTKVLKTNLLFILLPKFSGTK